MDIAFSDGRIHGNACQILMDKVWYGSVKFDGGSMKFPNFICHIIIYTSIIQTIHNIILGKSLSWKATFPC